MNPSLNINKPSRTASTALFIIPILLLAACGGGSGGSSGGPSLTGEFSGTAGSSTPMQLNLTESGTTVTGTATFDSETYTLEGEVSGDLFSFTALFKPTSTYCQNLIVTNADILNNKSTIRGRVSVRQQNCDGTGSVRGGVANFNVSK